MTQIEATPTGSEPSANRLPSVEYARLITFYLRKDQVDGEKTLAKWLRADVAELRLVDCARELGIDWHTLAAWENATMRPMNNAKTAGYLALLDQLWALCLPEKEAVTE